MTYVISVKCDIYIYNMFLTFSPRASDFSTTTSCVYLSYQRSEVSDSVLREWRKFLKRFRNVYFGKCLRRSDCLLSWTLMTSPQTSSRTWVPSLKSTRAEASRRWTPFWTTAKVGSCAWHSGRVIFLPSCGDWTATRCSNMVVPQGAPMRLRGICFEPPQPATRQSVQSGDHRTLQPFRRNYKAGTNPYLCLSLCDSPMADPGCWLLHNTVTTFRRLARKDLGSAMGFVPLLICWFPPGWSFFAASPCPESSQLACWTSLCFWPWQLWSPFALSSKCCTCWPFDWRTVPVHCSKGSPS